jgi:hypothetical protein
LTTKPTHGEIAHRAYELFLARGAQHGHADQDWFEAERELMGTGRSPKKTSRPRQS